MTGAEKTLLKLLDDVAKDQGYVDFQVELKPVSSGGANYTTALYTATITGPHKQDLHPLHLFAKVAILNDAVRKNFPCDIYGIENFAYNVLVKKYNNMQDKYNIAQDDRLVFAKCYASSSQMNVLENLIVQGFECHDRMKSIDWPYASKAVEVLAKFHAMSIALGEENSEEFESIVNKYEFNLEGNESQEEYIKKVKAHAMRVLEGEKREKMKKFLDQMTIAKMMELSSPIRRPVLVHGDYRPSNLMHRENKDGSMEVIPVDLQTLRAGCGVADLMYFIFCGSDKEFRDKYYRRLLDHYYDCLCARLKAAGLDPHQLYQREDFDYEVAKMQPLGIMIAVFLLPIVTVESSDAPNLEGRDDATLMSVARTSALYSERLNGIVDDAVRLGIL